MSDIKEKAPTPTTRMKRPADAEAGQLAKQGLRFKSKFNDAEYDRWKKALDAKRMRKSAS